MIQILPLGGGQGNHPKENNHGVLTHTLSLLIDSKMSVEVVLLLQSAVGI